MEDVSFQQRVLQRMMELTKQKEEALKEEERKKNHKLGQPANEPVFYKQKNDYIKDSQDAAVSLSNLSNSELEEGVDGTTEVIKKSEESIVKTDGLANKVL